MMNKKVLRDANAYRMHYDLVGNMTHAAYSRANTVTWILTSARTGAVADDMIRNALTAAQ